MTTDLIQDEKTRKFLQEVLHEVGGIDYPMGEETEEDTEDDEIEDEFDEEDLEDDEEEDFEED